MFIKHNYLYIIQDSPIKSIQIVLVMTHKSLYQFSKLYPRCVPLEIFLRKDHRVLSIDFL